MTRGTSLGTWVGRGAADLEQLESEGLDALEDAVERRLVGDLAPEHGVHGGGGRRQAFERVDQGSAELAADRDLVVG
jgi:hypothetical protein